tara:strand:+ start:325 stop:930 length:606 start_codon:yes stop_codon:yes gene_type:complete
MKPVAQSAAKEYSPATPEATRGATEFIEAVNSWSDRLHSAQVALRQFVREKVGEPRGYVARDHLNMSVFGLVFDKAPRAGFLAVPGPVADDLRSQGLRGEAYFPDTTHPLGKQVMGLMNQLSRVAEQRPLLNSVPGVAPVAIEGTRMVLSRAMVGADGGIVVKAGPSAIKPEASVRPVQRAEAAVAVSVEPVTRNNRTMRM